MAPSFMKAQISRTAAAVHALLLLRTEARGAIMASFPETMLDGKRIRAAHHHHQHHDTKNK